MARKRGLIEIRLDRRQAFYAVIGSLLVVSVAFVVGVIMGQRMTLSEGDPLDHPMAMSRGGDALAHEPIGANRPLDAPEAPPDDDETYTFYDELAAEPPRPLLLPEGADVSEPIGEPAAVARLLERETLAPETEPIEAAEPLALPAPEPRREPEPAPEPVVAEPNSAPPEPAPVARSQAPPTMQRRTVVRSNESEGPDEFGFFTVEAGRFRTFNDANALRNRLREAGHDAIVTIVVPGGGGERSYRVQVGSFTSRHDADGVARQIANLGFDASVVREG